MIPEPDMTVWFSGKELQRGKILSDFVGKNEKTKVIIKIQKKGNAAPARERVVSDDEQKQMMAYYYRKQQELKVCVSLSRKRNTPIPTCSFIAIETRRKRG